MVTPSSVYYELGEAISALLGVDFLTATPKKGRSKAIADSMVLSIPTFIGNVITRYSNSGQLELTLLVTASNINNLLILLDTMVDWFTNNRNEFNGYELLLTDAAPFYQGDEQSPELIGYTYNIQVNF